MLSWSKLSVFAGAAFVVVVWGCGGSTSSTQLASTFTKQTLGQALFNDKSLSSNGNQSCSSCHQAAFHFVDPRQDSPSSEGSVAGLFGNRQAPSAAYMSFSPPFHFDTDSQDYVGGNFWDGRAADLATQAGMPFLNPAEMNNSSKQDVVNKIMAAPLKDAMIHVFGPTVFATTDSAYSALTDAIAAFEQTPQFAPFTSKFDGYIQGRVAFSAQEVRGLNLFNGKAGCNGCHPSDGPRPLLTDFTYDNIGLPKNPLLRFYTDPANINPDGAAFIDHGLMNTTHRPEDDGRFKVPTLRNIAVTAPYFHNGVITNLRDAVEFYNKRDSGIFGTAEVPATQNNEELGNLGLSDQEVDDIVAFLKTLTDGYLH